MLIGIDVRPLMHGRTSGVENYMRSLLTTLFEVDTENQYVLYYNSKEDCGQFLPEFDGRRVKVVHTRYPNKVLNILWSFARWPRIDRMIERRLKRKIDLFFVLDPRPTPLSSRVKKVTTFHDLAFERYPQHFSFRSRLWFRLLKPQRELKTSDAVIAVSEFTKNELVDVYGADPEKVVAIPEAVPGKLNPVKSKEHLDQVRKKYQLPPQFFLTLSTIEPRKNIEAVIKGFGLFQKRYPLETQRLVLAGRHDPKMFGKVFLKDHPDIHMTGFVDEEDKAAVLSLAQGLIFVSTYEGFGLPVLEAMACGTPVITSSVASMPEVAGDAALLVDPRDIDQVAEAMHKLCLPESAQDYSEAGLKRVKQFSWKKAAKATLSLFESLMAS
jgi:glycosyltransferase involved in cell wall biosynthesis